MGAYERSQEARALSVARFDASPIGAQAAKVAAVEMAAAAIERVEAYVGVANYKVSSDDWAKTIAGEFLGELSPEARAKYQKIIRDALEAQRHGHTVGTAATQPAQQAADPVEHYRGEFVHEATDLVVAGAGLDFAFQRTYRSQSAGAGPLGYRWSFGYHMRLVVDERAATLYTGGGRQEDYVRHTRWPHDGFTYYVPPDGLHATVEPIGSADAPVGWVRRSPDGLRHVFSPDAGWSGAFVLTRIEDRWGNYLAFAYATRPSGVAAIERVTVNHPARWVRLAYDADDRIERVFDHTGRTWRYRYDAHGDLVGVTTPATPDQPRGATTEYRYSSRSYSGELAHLLTDIYDAEGRHYLATDYGTAIGHADYRRVVKQRVGTGDYWFRYEPVVDQDLGLAEQDRPAMRCWLKERNGHQSLFVYSGWGSLLWKEEADQGPGHAPRRVAWHYRYNRDGALTASRTPEGRVHHVLTGRDHFLRVQGIVDGDDRAARLWDHPALSAGVRRGFGNVLATVKRVAPRAAGANWSERWGDVYQIEPGDIVVKRTYEPEFQQVVTTSDPRATTASDPLAIEPPEYARLLTRCEYASDATRGLVRIVAPTPTLPDGTVGGPVVTEILARDPRGRVTRARDAVGTETETRYESDEHNVAYAGFAIETVVDPGGLAISTRVERDALGRAVRTHLPRSIGAPAGEFVVEQEFDALDRAVASRRATPLPTETRTRYEPAGKPKRIETDWVDADGAARGPVVRTIRYDEEHRAKRETFGGDELGRHHRIAHAYNAAGLRTLTVAPNDNSTQWKYDARDQIAKVIRGAGVGESIETFVRDREGRVVERRSPEGRTTMSTYDGLGRVVAVIDAAGHVARTSYDAADRPTVVRSFERQADGRFVLLARAETVYDELGRAVRSIASRFDTPPPAVEAAEVATAYEANVVGAVVEAQTFYDAAGRAVRVVDALGNATLSEYDAVGRAVRIVDPTGHRVETTYDAHGNVVRVDRIDLVRDGGGAVVGQEAFSSFAEYDQRDRKVREVDGLGNVVVRAYDSLDREVRTIDPLGNVTERVYDVYGYLTSVITRRTSTGDDRGAPIGPHVIRYERDPSGLTRARIDALGRRTEYRYDKRDRVVEEIFPDGARLATRYDRDSLVTAVRDARGVVVRTDYDALARPVRTSVDTAEVDPGVTIEGARAIDRRYDGLGRVVHAANEHAASDVQYDSFGRAVREDTTTPDGAVRRIARRFDDLGRVVELTYPGGRRLAYAHDAAGRVRTIDHVDDGAGYPGATAQPRTIAAYAYAGGRIRTATFANRTTTTVAHDARGGAIEIDHHGPSGVVLRVQQLRDGARAPRARAEAIGAAAAVRERFGYDSRYQLAARQDAADGALWDLAPFRPAIAPVPIDAPARQPLIDAAVGPRLGPDAPADADAWIYDLTGNRARATTPAASIDYAVDVRDRYTAVGATAPTYDRAGNLLSDGRFDYRYDGFCRLVRVVERATGATLARYEYDSSGRRIVEDRPGSPPVVITYDGLDRVADFRDGACVAHYVHGPAVDDPIELAAAGTHHIYHLDFQGSVRALTDRTGAVVAQYRFDPFGVQGPSSGPALGPPGAGAPAATQPFGFAARPIDPATGHYDTRARVYLPSIGRFLQRDPAGPVDGHLYAYAGNHPLAFGDPSGLGRDERSAPADEVDEGRAYYESLPELTKPNNSLYWSEGYVHKQWRAATDAMWDPSNPTWGRVVAGGLGFGATPLAAAEEYVVRPFLNIPHALWSGGVRIGEHAARALRLAREGYYGYAAVEGISAVRDGSSAFVQGVAPFTGLRGPKAPVPTRQGLATADDVALGSTSGATATGNIGRTTATAIDSSVSAVGSVPEGFTRVGRWMSPDELAAMRTSGRVQAGAGGVHRVAVPADASAYKAAPTGDVFVTYDVATGTLRSAGNDAWRQIVGPDSIFGRLAARRGEPVPEMPTFQNLVVEKAR